MAKTSSNGIALTRAKAVECGLCTALAPPGGWALRGEPKPAAALLSVPSHYEA